MASVPTLVGGRFELRGRIGAGSLSEVFDGVDRATGRQVAVKLGRAGQEESAAARLRFEREASALSVIASPHVVELISAGETETGRAYLVLERLRGRDLREVLQSAGTIPPRDVAVWLGEAAAALELAHGLDIVHRDLKPANLYLHVRRNGEPVVKLLDFGMVVDVAGPRDRGRDAFGGTPMYMAPEQVRGQLTRIGPATDIWALAMVAITLLTGESYWAGGTTRELLREIETSPLMPPSSRWPWLPRAFDAWFEQSTRRVPERRFRNVGEQAARLADALRDVSAPDRTAAAAAVGTASTISARTPTPAVVQLPGLERSVVGRQVECAEIEALLEPGQVVTLAGPAGIGKTCLAEVVRAALSDNYPDGAWFVPLGSGEAEAAITGAIATALSMEPDSTMRRLHALASRLASRSALLVLDGAEQVSGAAGVIEELRAACPTVTWLVTSRLPLGFDGERSIGVEPLDVPAADADALTPGEARTFSAIELFVRRARELRPDFRIDTDNVADVVTICRMVDGIPLGIELAAAQIPRSNPAHVRRALANASRVGATDLVHAEGVRAAVAWSYGLLSPEQQAVLRHLAVFPDGLPFRRIAKLFGHVTDDPAGAVMRLAESRLVTWTDGAERRLVMLDTVRDLCRALSAELGEDEALRKVARHHAEAVARFATADVDTQEAWLDLIDREHDNLREVLSDALDSHNAFAMRLAGDLAWYWYLRGHYVEGAHWLEEAIARSGAVDGASLTRGLCGAGRLWLLSCDYKRAQSLLERARDLAYASGDDRCEADAVQLLGSVSRELGACRGALRHHRRALELWTRLGDAREAARTRNYLVFAAWLGDPAGDPGDEQRDWWQGGLDHALRELADPEAIVWSLLNRGAIAHYAGDREGARDALSRAFAEAAAARFYEGIAWSLNLIGLASFNRGEHLQARAQLATSLRVHRRLGDLWRCASVLEALAAVEAADGQGGRAAVFLGAADRLRDQIEAPVPTCERPLVDRTEDRCIQLIGDEYGRGRQAGWDTPLDQIVALARER